MTRVRLNYVEPTKEVSKKGAFPHLTGRPKGTPNRRTKAITDAIIEGASRVGSDGNGEGGLAGYFERIARKHPRAFMPIIARLIPVKVNATNVDLTRMFLERLNNPPPQSMDRDPLMVEHRDSEYSND